VIMIVLIWVKLLGLPMELWLKRALKDINDFLGKIMDVDISFISSI
jgi:hypothetical protein